MLWKWLAIVGMSMTPNLVVGSSMAAFFGIRWGFDPWLLLAVMIVASSVEGAGVAWLAGRSTNWRWVQRMIKWMHKPRAIAFANKWGVWGGMTLGVAVVGQEPILVALRWLDVPMRKLWLPIVVANIIQAVGYYWLIKAGLVVIEPWW